MCTNPSLNPLNTCMKYEYNNVLDNQTRVKSQLDPYHALNGFLNSNKINQRILDHMSVELNENKDKNKIIFLCFGTS